MAGEIFFFFLPLSFFFLASSCTLASKHPLLRYRLGVIASEQSGEAGVGEEGGGVHSPAGWLVLLPVRDDHKEAADPSCAPSGIYSPCHGVIAPSHAAFPLPTYQHPYSYAESLLL